MKITLHQTHHSIADFDSIRAHLSQLFASETAAGIHLFPELFLCGYPLQDLVLQKDFIDSYQENLRLIDVWCQEKFKGTASALLLGGLHYEFDTSGLPLTIENCIYEAKPGCPLKKIYVKKLLPNYDIFDEEKYFSPGRESGIWEFEGEHYALMICEDMWTSSLHPIDPTMQLAQDFKALGKTPRAIFNLSASPYNLGKPERRHSRALEIASEFGAPFYYVNRVGGEDEILFDGRSFCQNPGKMLTELSPWVAQSETMEIEAPLKAAPTASARTLENTWESLFAPRLDQQSPPLLTELADEDCAELIRALGFGTHEYARKCGFNKYTIALSGGIDSSLVLTLLRLTLPEGWGLEALFMPGLYTAGESYDLAQALCQNLGVKLTTTPIKFFHSTVKNAYRDSYGLELDGLANENIQSRLRGAYLYARSNHSGSMVVNTSNKSEIAVGYSTQYGDSVGAISMLGDLYKSEVYVLSRYINRAFNGLMPEGLITRLPSAELREDQHDQQSLPPYLVLDAILEGILSYRLSTNDLIAKGFSREDVEKVFRLYTISEYKRLQFCPIIKVRPKSFGFGHRIPITKRLTPLRREK